MFKNTKILLMGDHSVGKTSICERIKYNKFNNNIKSTIGVEFYTKIFDHGKIQIWDTSGQEQFRFLLKTYLVSASLNIIVFDLSNIDSFNNIKNFIKLVRKKNNNKIILVGNKADLKYNVSFEEIQSLISKNNIEFIEVSAKTNLNINCLKKMIYSYISVENELNSNEDTVLLLENNDNNIKNVDCCGCICF